MANDVCSHVKVVVRVRPENEREKRENYENVVQVVDNHMLIFDPKQEDVSCFGSQRVRSRNITKKAKKDLKFVFDHVFNENSTQLDIFENTTKAVLDGLMNGFNCTGKKERKTLFSQLVCSHLHYCHHCLGRGGFMLLCNTCTQGSMWAFFSASFCLFGSVCNAFTKTSGKHL